MRRHLWHRVYHEADACNSRPFFQCDAAKLGRHPRPRALRAGATAGNASDGFLAFWKHCREHRDGISGKEGREAGNTLRSRAGACW